MASTRCRALDVELVVYLFILDSAFGSRSYGVLIRRLGPLRGRNNLVRRILEQRLTIV